MNEKLSGILKYFSIDMPTICTKVINEIEPFKLDESLIVESKYGNIIKKYLLNNSFYESGFKYDFLNVEFNEKIFYFTINVTLPKDGQSYATPKFSHDIGNILDNFSKYLQTSIPYLEKILVDGKEPVKGGLFISNKKQQEILTAVRENIKRITIKTEIGMLSYDVQWREPDNGKFYRLDDNSYIDFYFFIKLSNFSLKGKSVNPNLDIIDDIAGSINDEMHETDSVKIKIENIILDVLENELEIVNGDDIFVVPLWYISHIDGLEVNTNVAHFDFGPETFISVD